MSSWWYAPMPRRACARVGCFAWVLLALFVVSYSPSGYAADSCNLFTNGAQTHGAGSSFTIQSGAQVLNGGTSIKTGSISDNGANLSCGTADCVATGTPASPLTYSFPTGISYTNNLSISSGGSASVSQGNYSNITVGTNATVTFSTSGGTYHIQNLSIGDGATLNMAPGSYYIKGEFSLPNNGKLYTTGTSGLVRIFTEQTARFMGSAQMPGATDAKRLFVWANNTIDFQTTTTGSNAIRAFLYAHTQNAQLGNNAVLYGGIAGSTAINTQSNVKIYTIDSTGLDISAGCSGGSGGASAACKAIFADGFSHAALSRSITFNANTKILNSPDNILATTSIIDNGTTSCNSGDCTASNSIVGTITTPTYNGGSNVVVANNGNVYINPGHYGSATINTSGNLYLNTPGDYYFNGGVTFGQWAYIRLVADGTARVFINGNLLLDNANQLNFNPGTTKNLVLVVTGGTSTLGKSTGSSGWANRTLLYSKGAVTLHNGFQFQGAITSEGNAVLNANNSWIDYSSSTVNAVDYTGLSCGAGAVAPPPAQLRASWRLDEFAWSATANEILDSSGNNLHGQAVNDVNLPAPVNSHAVVTGSPGTCYHGAFSSLDGYLQVSDPGTGSLLDRADFSIGLWVKPTSFPASDKATLLKKGTNYALHLLPSGQIELAWAGTSLVSTSSLSLNAWTHVAATFVSASQQLYLNGVLDRSGTSATAPVQDNSALSIGNDLTSTSRRFNGYLDEVNVYSGVLTLAEVNTLKNTNRTCSVPATTLRGEWRFDELNWAGTAAEVRDSSNSAQHATANQVSGFPQTANITPALSGATGSCRYGNFSGATNSNLSLADPGANWIYDFTSRYSVSFWFRRSQWPAAGQRENLVKKSGTFNIEVTDSQRLMFWWFDGSSWNSITSPSNLSLNTWYHVVATYQRGRQTLYINGSPVVTGSLNTPLPVNSDMLAMGGHAVSGWNAYHGFIDEVRIYDGELTAAEVASVQAATHVCPAENIASHLVGRWRFEELTYNGTPGEVVDSGPNALHGASNAWTAGVHVSTSDITPAITGNPGSCGYASLSNTNGFINIPDPGMNSPLDLTRNFSLGAWVKVTNLAGAGTHNVIRKHMNYTVQVGNDGSLRFWWYASDNNWRSFYSAPGLVSQGTWYHIAFNYQNGLQEFFLNGVRVATKTDAFDATVSNDALMIGRDGDLGTEAHIAVDDVRVYNTILTTGNLADIMAETHACRPISENLVAHWTFEQLAYDGTPNEVVDSGPNALHGASNAWTAGVHVSTATATPAITGDPGSCRYASLSNANGFINIPDPGVNSALDLTRNFSLTAWVKVTNLAGAGTHNVIRKDMNYTVQVGNDGSLRFWWYASDNNWRSFYSASGLVSQGAWYHIAFAYQNGLQEFFLNGVRVATKTDAFDATVSNDALMIGRDYDLGTEAHIAVDDVRIYNKVLNTDNLAEIMAETHGCSLGEAGLLAAWNFDQMSWTGAVGEVLDSTGNYPGQAHSGAATAQQSPAIPGNTGTCQYGVFNGTNSVVTLPNFPNVTGSFTIAAWTNTQDMQELQQRIFSDDDTNQGYFFGLNGNNLYNGAARYGSFRLITRASTPSGNNLTDSVNNLYASNSWVHLATTYNHFSGAKTLYLNGVPVQLDTGGTTETLTAWTSLDAGMAAIGNESPSSGEPNMAFNGYLDEVRFYQTALTASEITGLMSQTRACTFNDVSHLLLSAPATASTCSPATVSISVIKTDGSVKTDFTGTISLTTSTNRGDWSKTAVANDALGSLSAGASDAGSATYTFVAADAGTISLQLTNRRSETLTVAGLYSDFNKTGVSGAMAFSSNAFTLVELTSPPYIVGRDMQYQVLMQQSDPVTGVCATNTSYSRSGVKLWLTRSAASPAGALPTVVDGQGGGTATVPASEPASNNVNLTFVNGSATFALKTTDVNQFTLSVKDDSQAFLPLTLVGQKTGLNFQPFGFWVSADANPGATSAAGARFKEAGQSFTARATAVAWQAADDANNDGAPDNHGDGASNRANLADNAVVASFGTESPAETVTLSANLLLPAGGNNPGLTDRDSSVNDGRVLRGFSGGVASTSQIDFNEVGIIELKASLTDGQYGAASAGHTALMASYSGAVGRFSAAKFDLGATQINAACTAGLDFTYFAQGFTGSMTLVPQSQYDSALQNYHSGFDKLAPSGFTFYARDASGVILSSRLAAAVDNLAQGGGSITASLGFSLARAPTLDGPYASVAISAAVADSDGITLKASSLSADADGNGAAESAEIGVSEFRFGRLRLGDAYGPETHALPVNLQVEYWQAPDWLINKDDSCTAIALADITYPAGPASSLANRTVTLGAQTTTGFYDTVSGGNILFASGKVGHYFSAPGANQTGEFATGIDLTDFPWLRFDWDADGDFDDTSVPDNRVRFGQYRGHDRRIFWREF